MTEVVDLVKRRLKNIVYLNSDGFSTFNLFSTIEKRRALFIVSAGSFSVTIVVCFLCCFFCVYVFILFLYNFANWLTQSAEGHMSINVSKS